MARQEAGNNLSVHVYLYIRSDEPPLTCIYNISIQYMHAHNKYTYMHTHTHTHVVLGQVHACISSSDKYSGILAGSIRFWIASDRGATSSSYLCMCTCCMCMCLYACVCLYTYVCQLYHLIVLGKAEEQNLHAVLTSDEDQTKKGLELTLDTRTKSLT